jgi:hypothetical protein
LLCLISHVIHPLAIGCNSFICIHGGSSQGW